MEYGYIKGIALQCAVILAVFAGFNPSAVSAFPASTQLQVTSDFFSKPLTLSTSAEQVGPGGELSLAFQASPSELGFLTVFLPDELLQTGNSLVLTLDLPTFIGGTIAPLQMGLPDMTGVALNASQLSALLWADSSQLGSFCHASGTSSLPSTQGETLSQGSIIVRDEGSGAEYLDVEAHVGILTQQGTALYSMGDGSAPSCELAEPTTTGEQLNGDGGEPGLAQQMEWCISWFSSNCKRTKTSKCNRGASCVVSYSRLLSWALGSPSSIIQACAQFGASELLARCLEKNGIGWSGKCNKVYILGIISGGCQCVLS